MKSYLEKLKDPRWQKRRLEALSAAEFTCQFCDDKDSELHVHHKGYLKDFEPWDYSDAQLIVLCRKCHDIEHDKKRRVNEFLSFISGEDLHLAIGFLASIFHTRNTHDPSVFLNTCNFTEIEGYARGLLSHLPINSINAVKAHIEQSAGNRRRGVYVIEELAM